MGAIEKRVGRDRRWGAFQKSLLTVVAIGGIVLVAAAVPNTARLLRYFPGYKKGARFNYQAKSALGRLAQKGLIVFVEERGKRYARITDKGQRVLEMEVKSAESDEKRRWDGRWRVVIFDISESRRRIRTRFRRLMEQHGFVRLQDSVWIYPYDCEDIIALAKTDLHLGADVLYMVVERLERDKYLREHFKLSPD